MKLSNIVLASIITSSLSVTAQVEHTKKDSIVTKQNIKPEKTLTTKDSIALKKAEKEQQERKRVYYDNCPACGMG